MLHNNLDPEVAERPQDLVVYGGTGKAARDWPSFEAITRELTELGDDQRAWRLEPQDRQQVAGARGEVDHHACVVQSERRHQGRRVWQQHRRPEPRVRRGRARVDLRDVAGGRFGIGVHEGAG